MVTNEQATLYFKEIKQENFVMKIKVGGKWANENKLKTLLERVQTKGYAKTYTGAVYRTYSMIDLFDLLYVKEHVTKREEFYIETSTILSTYAGHTIFSLFLEHDQVYEQILQQFKEQDF
jgi:hypothetical protein